jgi:threonine/homoserine/homoserine lactone efflux protein
MDLLTFALVSIGIILVPGPNVLVVISTSISNGKLRGVQTVAGTSIAMAIQLVIAAMATAWFVTALKAGLLWLKWAGVVYLVYLGVSHLVKASSDAMPGNSVTALGSFQRGFWVSLTNPKTILFFGAFLPQFVSPSEPYLTQIAILSVIFWILAVALDSGYALLASKLTSLLRSKELTKYQNGASGILYLGAGATLVVTRNG